MEAEAEAGVEVTSPWVCLAMTMLGAAGTALGGLLVVLRPEMPPEELGILQSFSAGLMLCLSCMELMPVSIRVLGFGPANLWFFSGVAFFAVIVAFIPEPELGVPQRKNASGDRGSQNGRLEGHEALSSSRSGQSSGEGTAAALLHRRGKGEKHARRTQSHPSPKKINRRRLPPSRLQQEEGEEEDIAVRQKVMFSGLITAIGIALHNFPEGIAVMLASLKSSQVGLSVSVAIALHNVPEGVAVALPVYYATKSRWKGLLYAIAGGLAEPLAVLLFGGFFLPFTLNNVSPEALEAVMAAVGGIMAYLSLHELLPMALTHVSKQAAVHSLFAGMALMSLNLYVLEVFTDSM